jgi:hypothetical protein
MHLVNVTILTATNRRLALTIKPFICQATSVRYRVAKTNTRFKTAISLTLPKILARWKLKHP